MWAPLSATRVHFHEDTAVCFMLSCVFNNCTFSKQRSLQTMVALKYCSWAVETEIPFWWEFSPNNIFNKDLRSTWVAKIHEVGFKTNGKRSIYTHLERHYLEYTVDEIRWRKRNAEIRIWIGKRRSGPLSKGGSASALPFPNLSPKGAPASDSCCSWTCV